MPKLSWILAPLLALSCLVALPPPAAAQPAAAPVSAAQLEANKQAVLGFYKGVSQFDFEAARPFMGDFYIQHSPMIEDGLEGLKKALDGYREEFKGHPPTLDVKLVLAEGDYVVMLSQVVPKPGSPGIAVGDLFRLQNGKIVEHWDITEWLKTKPAGEGMFDEQDKAGEGWGKM